MSKKALIVITGSVASLKTPILVRLLKKSGYSLTCVLSKCAEKFITPFLLENISENKCYVEDDFWREQNIHVHLAKSHDVLIYYPCSANTLVKLAYGIADNFVTTLQVAFEGPRVLMPAMHQEMIDQQTVIKALRLCDELGWFVLGPVNGDLLSGDCGGGRCIEPEDVCELMDIFFLPKLELSKRNVLVSAGGTVESIDSIRVLSNLSSGKMGHSVAKLACLYGARVSLVTTKNVSNIGFYKTMQVTSSEEMLYAMSKLLLNIDSLVMSAAVSDFTLDPMCKKIRRSKKSISLKLKPTVDILEHITKSTMLKRVIGFTLLDSLTDRKTILDKCKRKGCDFMFANTSQNLGSDMKNYHVYNKHECIKTLKNINVTTVAYELLKYLN